MLVEPGVKGGKEEGGGVSVDSPMLKRLSKSFNWKGSESISTHRQTSLIKEVYK